jgi:beta-lactamase regulating signal transducer with metallopeptidase domain
MNQLGITLVWVAVQATLLAVAAAACYIVAARRGPGSAARVAAGFLAALTALPILAFCPLPQWPAWQTPSISSASVEVPREDASRLPSPEPESDAPQSAGGLNLAATLAALRDTWKGMGRPRGTAGARQPNWPMVVAALFLVGAGLGLLRLLLGVRALHRWCRRGRRVDDPALLAFIEELRGEMGGPTALELREAADLSAPATVGWLRPVILLPADWRDWGEAERRAVLAHEWAHVCRRDYLAALVARVGVALHFYHPLVYWLAGRLHLQQELEADALGARHAGGRDPYLRALARMALRQEGRPLAWPAKAFLSGTGTLTRRIHVLQSKVLHPERPQPRARGLALLLLAAAVLGVSALRSPAQPDEEPQAAKESPAMAGESLPPFDLSFLPSDSMGAVGFRPAVLLGRPELRPALDVINLGASLMSRGPGMPDGLKVRLEDIEQIVCTPRVETRKTKKGPQSTFLMGLTMVRMVKDFDWKAHVKKLAPDAEEIDYGGKTYFKLPLSHAFFIFESPKAACYLYVPDARTLVMDTDTNLRRLIDGKQEAPRRSWAKDWKRVECSAIAIALDLQDKRWLADRRQPEEGLSPEELLILKNARCTVFGVAVAEKITVESLVRCAEIAKGNELARAIEDMVAEGRESLEQEREEGKAEGFELQWRNFERDLLRNAQATREGTLIRWRTEARLDFAELSRSLLSATGLLREEEEKLRKMEEKLKKGDEK